MQTKKLDNLPRYMKVSRKKVNGVVYTPTWIVNTILDKVDYKNNIYNRRIIDPACGEGIFLIRVVDIFLKDCVKNNLNINEIKKLLKKNIYGFDIDKTAIAKCKINLNKIIRPYGIKKIQWNILCIDSLNKNKVKKYFSFFDYVVGNPPYIRIQHLGKERRNRIQRSWSFCKSGSTDMYIAFFELGIQLLNDNGKLGYITPNTFFKTQTSTILRHYLKTHKLIKTIINFGHYQVFRDVTTYSTITILDKKWKKNKFYYFNYNVNTKKIEYIDEIKLSDMCHNNIWILTSNKNLNKIREIEDRGPPLGKIAKIHVGITTLADDFYIFQNPIIKGNIAKITLKDGRTFHIEKDILKPIIKVSVLKSLKDEQNRFIIFPYRKVNNKYIIIYEDELKKSFPLTYKYFLTIKERLSKRDKGKPNPISWYAFGRSQGFITSWGKKILVSPLSLKPNFIVWEKKEYTFYAGYCIKFDGDLHWLADQLNSKDMKFYIKYVARDYRNGYKSYAKSFISNFGILGYKNKNEVKTPRLFKLT